MPAPKAKPVKAKASSKAADGSTTQRTARAPPKKKSASSKSGSSTARTARETARPADLELPTGAEQIAPSEISPDSVLDKLDAVEEAPASRRGTMEGARRRPRPAALDTVKDSAPLVPEALEKAAEEPSKPAGEPKAMARAMAMAAARARADALAMGELADRYESTAVPSAKPAQIEPVVSAAAASSASSAKPPTPAPKLAAAATVMAAAAAAALPSLRAESLSMRMAARRMERQQHRAGSRRPSLDANAAPSDISAAAAGPDAAGALPGSSEWQPPPQRVNARLDAELTKMREERGRREAKLFAQLEKLSSSSGAIASTSTAIVQRGGGSSSSTALMALGSSDTTLAADHTTTLASGESIRTAELLKMLRSKTSRRWLRQWLEQPGRVDAVKAAIAAAPAPLRQILVDVLSRILCDEPDEEEAGARITMLGRHAQLQHIRGDVASREGGAPRLLEGPRLLNGPLLLELKV